MGMKAMTKVWEWSRSSGNDRMVLLAIADHANDDDECFPGVARIAKKSRISERTVQRCFKNLEKLGELIIKEGEGFSTKGGKTNLFIITVKGGDKLSGSDNGGKKVVTNRTKGSDTAMSPKPSVEPSVEPKYNGKFKKPILGELNSEAIRIGLTKEDGEEFFLHHEARGWNLRSGPMVCWKSALETWKRNKAKFAQNGTHGASGSQRPLSVGILDHLKLTEVPGPDFTRLAKPTVDWKLEKMK